MVDSEKPPFEKKLPEEPKEKGFKRPEKIEDIYKLASSNARDTLAYIALIIGLLLLFFDRLLGGCIIGIIAGLYFSKEIMAIVRNLEDFIENLGVVRSLILGGALLGLLIEAPAIFLGLAVAIGLKQIIFPDDSESVK